MDADPSEVVPRLNEAGITKRVISKILTTTRRRFWRFDTELRVPKSRASRSGAPALRLFPNP